MSEGPPDGAAAEVEEAGDGDNNCSNSSSQLEGVWKASSHQMRTPQGLGGEKHGFISTKDIIYR